MTLRVDTPGRARGAFVQERLEQCELLLATGASTSTIVKTLMTEHNLRRRSAYDYLQRTLTRLRKESPCEDRPAWRARLTEMGLQTFRKAQDRTRAVVVSDVEGGQHVEHHPDPDAHGMAAAGRFLMALTGTNESPPTSAVNVNVSIDQIGAALQEHYFPGSANAVPSVPPSPIALALQAHYSRDPTPLPSAPAVIDTTGEVVPDSDKNSN